MSAKRGMKSLKPHSHSMLLDAEAIPDAAANTAKRMTYKPNSQVQPVFDSRAEF
jgi:hypothetical protein